MRILYTFKKPVVEVEKKPGKPSATMTKENFCYKKGFLKYFINLLLSFIIFFAFSKTCLNFLGPMLRFENENNSVSIQTEVVAL